MTFSTSQAIAIPAERFTIPTPIAAVRGLRIALFSGNYDCVRDGANKALNRLVDHLQEVHGAEVRIYSPRAPRPAFASVGDVRAVRSLSLPGRPEYRLALGLTRATRRDFDAFAPDIVHLSAPDLLGWQALGHARRNSIPVIASLHTRFETYADYYRLGFLRGAIDRYLRGFYGRCDKILAPTDAIAKDLSCIHGEARVGIWGRGVDREIFHPRFRQENRRALYGYAPSDIVLLFFGRLVLEKGLDVFAQTVVKLRERGYPLRPLIVGEGPAKSWLARTLPNATFAGHLEGVDLGETIAGADILVNPSVTEAFGNVNLEAAASGLPVVSADVPSAASLITHGKTGLLVDPKNAEAYADAVESLIQDPERRRKMGAMASASADMHRWHDVLASVHEAYCECLDAARRQPVGRGMSSCVG